MTKIYELETERLRLRQWTESDLRSFARINADKRVMEFFPQALSQAESDQLAERITNAIAQRGWGLWAVEVKNQHPFIGFVGLHVPSVKLPFSPCVEAGWRLDDRYWGKGYATEAAKAAITFGFKTLNLAEIVSFTALINQRSQAVMHRLGMVRTLEPFLHPSVPKNSELQAHCLYKLSKANWKTQQGAEAASASIS